MNPGSARRVLLSALDPSNQAPARLSTEGWEDLPWTWIHDRAMKHKVAALFASRMEEHGHAEKIPEPFRAKLAKVLVDADARVEATRHTLVQVSEAFRRAKIDFFATKGPFLAEKVYGDPRIRPFSDLDVVVRKDQLGGAERALVELGYRFYNAPFISRHSEERRGPVVRSRKPAISDAEARRLYLEHHRCFPFVLPNGDDRRPVDLHWALANPRVLRAAPERLWDWTTEETVFGMKLRILKPEASLVHVAVHAMEQAPFSFKILHLCDVVWMLHRLGPTLRMDDLRKLLEEWGGEGHLLRAIQLARRVFPFRFEAPPLAAKSRWTDFCYRAGGIDGVVMDHPKPANGAARLVSTLAREAWWDLSWRRPPRIARRRLGNGVAKWLAAAKGRYAEP